MDCYIKPKVVSDSADCNFYHRTHLKELDAQKSDWDLTDCVSDYLGQVDYAGKRALDVGAASGEISRHG